ncbi:MAG TPA: alkaline phosphatase D family protein [Chitinophagaceae bacterium]|nr:alkaline phosphatase family protein [Chitinophagaceae bacterium]MCB9054583.1 alkaline phosphatase family protein [Chitinophagales bacterium]HPG10223.1 alkaline phosphatase D family protein [Chitinophagaceae bacterium]
MRSLITVSVLVFSYYLNAQPRIISGPMLGPVELRDAKVWVEVSPEVNNTSIQFNKKGDSHKKTVLYKGELGNDFNPVTFVIGGLDINTTYEYAININGKSSGKKGEFTTKDLWQWRKPAPDFSFLTGSCAYFNQPIYDRPGKPYGGDSSIFETMAKERSSFMLWLGDAWYTREVDYFSEWGLWYRASHDRALPVLQNFLKAMPHFATWDDHDYGPNDIGTNYILKDKSREVFNKYFCNPSAGENGQGIYTMTSYGDVDLFMTDDRWWRSADRTKDSIDGKPNPEKRMLGKQQMEWLKNSLLYSGAVFKIIVVGSQVLNPVSPYDKLKDFPVEYDELMDFLAENKINGVLFLTGDRHHSEIIKVERPGAYPLFDITVSPLTSGTHTFGGPEKNNPYRVLGIDEKQNYAKFSITGKRGQRSLSVRYFGIKGEELGEWSISEKDLKYK